MSEQPLKKKDNRGGRKLSFCQPLLCVETGQHFISMREALDWLGIKNPTNLAKALKNNVPYRGYNFEKLPRTPKKEMPVNTEVGQVGRKRIHFDVSPEARRARLAAYVRNYNRTKRLLNPQPEKPKGRPPNRPTPYLPRSVDAPLVIRCGKCQALVTKGCEQVNCKFIQSKRRCKI